VRPRETMTVSLPAGTIARLAQFGAAMPEAVIGLGTPERAARLLILRGLDALALRPVPRPSPATYAETVREIRAMAAAGVSQRKIAAALDAAGLRSRRGGRWDQAAVSRVLAKAAREG